MSILLNTRKSLFYYMRAELLPMVRTIKISDDTHKLLIEIGGKSETFDDVIRRLIDSYQKSAKK
jgi:hypothetical protein